MAVIRVEKSKDYSIISNTPLQDKNLSLKAKGLLALVFTLPNNWEYSVNGICKIVKEGRDAVLTAFKELEQNGYLKREKQRTSDGKFSSVVYVFYEFPQNLIPQSENSTSEKSTSEKPIQKNTNIKKYINKKTCQQSSDCDVVPVEEEDFPLTLSDFPTDSQEYIIAKTLRNNILELRPQAKVPRYFKEMQKWASVIDKMLRIDNIPVNDMYKVLDYVKHNEFWSRNILSPSALRKHFDRLMITINQKPQEKPTPQPQTVSSKADKVLEKLMGEGGLYD